MLDNPKQSPIPELNTIYTKPFKFLEQQFFVQRKIIDDWFAIQWSLTIPPVYGSVDLRNAGFKVAPIDMNLFPSGFNNLNSNFLSQTVVAAQHSINKIMPNVKKVLVIPESHTRNLFYWSNIKTLEKILENAGFEVRFGMLDGEITQKQDIHLAHGEKITIFPLLRQADKLYVKDFFPDFILLNNDLSEGIPEILKNLEQQLIPPAELGWSQRLKSDYFQYYTDVAAEFATQIAIDPWLISPLFRHCGHIDFLQQEGIDCLMINAEMLFGEIQKKYAEYQIPHQPFLIVKADAGTYGMAVMTVRNVDELKSLNRKQRTRMSMTKGGQPVHRVIIQEGVYSFETFGKEQAVAEPVVYLWGSCVIGGFYRVHKNRGVDENLNAPGMHFEPIAFSHNCNQPQTDKEIDQVQHRLYIYGIIAQLSTLAAAREIKDQTRSAR